ncbi:hypothetical protein [Opitutus terrae]|uniref:Uncharacterized protein n=1 Tax=Opitutus terrae (strain DSM 11246 / JCM 15787 / PB90-1) TaxID=452637 RepID=B1ZQE2_OPITP|nr:hypothetical protein [Opitutus terrae]ACB73622.1 hypothetical protein Oter_0332 [Opitutus terrae PB90-1]
MSPEIGGTVLLKDGRVCVIRSFADTWRGPTWTATDKAGKEVSFGPWDYRAVLSEGAAAAAPTRTPQPAEVEGQAALF